MWFGEVKSTDLFNANRWTVSFFKTDARNLSSGFPMHPVREVAHERRGAVDPQQLGDMQINYLGLENVRSLTGELVDFSPRPAPSVKSRSKIFKEGDVLYSRLRPELNKVFLAHGEVSEGLCSGEFIVLVPKLEHVLPRYLRYTLASSYITKFASKLKVGASLPRMAAEDLLGIEIPIPPMAIQEKIVKQLQAVDLEIMRLRERLESLPHITSKALLGMLVSGTEELEAL